MITAPEPDAIRAAGAREVQVHQTNLSQQTSRAQLCTWSSWKPLSTARPERWTLSSRRSSFTVRTTSPSSTTFDGSPAHVFLMRSS